MKEEYKLSHLKELEAESIHIIREVAAEFENPVMLYSIGKDSSVMVRLAEKAFYPGKVPFPLMHIDSKWKFKEMIQFRDEYAKKYGWNLIVESNMEAFKALSWRIIPVALAVAAGSFICATVLAEIMLGLEGVF